MASHKMWKELVARGIRVGKERVRKLMKLHGIKALRSSIEQLCGRDAKVQRCRIHKIRNVSERLPKDRAEQVRWLMKQAFKLDAPGSSSACVSWPKTSRPSIQMPQSAFWKDSIKCSPLPSWESLESLLAAWPPPM